MQELSKELIDEKLIGLTISNPRKKTDEEGKAKAVKIKIRPLKLRGQIVYQKTEYIGTQVFHENLDLEKARKFVEDVMIHDYKQCEARKSDQLISVLVSKKGKATVKKKKMQNVKIDPQSHNRKKQYLLEEGTAIPFLVDLGVMTKEGKIVSSRYDKYKQINRFLEFIRDIVPKLPKGREITIIDFGCGKSYLTFAVYYYLHEVKKMQVRMIGLDLKEDVIDHCNALAKKYGYDHLSFQKGDIAQFEDTDAVDMVMTLHACDMATDYALLKAIAWNASVILSVPCCQHEVNGQINSELLAPILEYGILKERLSAIITDGLRCQKLKEAGYHTQILEFIDMEHTPKNLLIRAVKDQDAKVVPTSEKVERMMEEMHIDPAIYRL